MPNVQPAEMTRKSTNGIPCPTEAWQVASATEVVQAASSLASISLLALEHGTPVELKKLRAACQQVGFFYLKDHGVPQQCVDRVFVAARGSFAASQELKDPVRYTVAGDATDHKEAFDWAEDPLFSRQLFHGMHSWPRSIDDFQADLEEYHGSISQVSVKLLRALCVALGKEVPHFDHYFNGPLSSTHIASYPPAEEVNAQTDGSFFTLVYQDESSGLQAEFQAGHWVDAPPVSGSFVVNIGDHLASLSDFTWRSTPHRIVSGTQKHMMLRTHVAVQKYVKLEKPPRTLSESPCACLSL